MSDPQAPVATFPLPGAARITISDQIIVRVSGAGTDKFLQGQFSQQMADVTERFSPRAAACSPKGRAYCLTRMVRDGEDVLMALPASMAEDTITHLRKYLMLFRGTSMAVDDSSSLIGLLGQPAAEAVTDDPVGKLATPGDSLAIPGGRLIRTMDTGEGLIRFELWQTGEMSAECRKALDALEEDQPVTWHASEIAAGVTTLSPDTRESYVPQMLNWQHLGGVHFKKGCYTGQEVIARMHFLGQLKKSLFRFSCPAEGAPLATGMALVRNEKSVGEIVNAVQLSDGHSECLAVVRHDAADADLALKHAPGILLKQLPLPYSVPEREQQAES